MSIIVVGERGENAFRFRCTMIEKLKNGTWRAWLGNNNSDGAVVDFKKGTKMTWFLSSTKKSDTKQDFEQSPDLVKVTARIW